jgi:hypothetical protein
MIEWVVTYRIAQKGTANWGMAEFFRGSEAQCKHIQAHFAGGECDIVETNPWEILIGPVEDWHDFLQAAEAT